jgi:hypothetical protein
VLPVTLGACSGDAPPPDLPPLPQKLAPAGLGPSGPIVPLREAILAFTAEVRGEIEPCGCPTVPYGGFVRREALLGRLRAEGLPVFVIDAGEMLVRGQVAADPGDRPERARAVLDLAARTGLDAWAPGPVDLLAGGLRTLSGTNALAATWRDATGEAPFPAATVIERDGFRLGVVGLNASASGLTHADPVEAARAAIAGGGEADTWVALSNLADADALRVAESVPGLGAVLSTRGSAFDAPRTTRGAPIIETPDRGRYVTVIRLALASDGAAWKPVTGAPYENLARERERVVRLEKAAAIDAAEARLPGLRTQLATVASGHDLALVEERPLGSDLDAPSPLDARIESFKARATEGAAARVSRAPPVAGYASGAACTGCHDHSERFAAWTLDPHARAYEALVPRGEALNVECIACHSTGWGEPGGNATLTPVAMRTWKAVQCEACHGPLAGHPHGADVTPAPVTEATCVRCHDAANSPQFDFASYVRRISCASVSRQQAEAR